MRELKGEEILQFIDEYSVIDIETTGFDPKRDSIIEIGVLKVSNGEIVNTYSTLIKSKNEISEFIENLTGISNKDLENAKDLKTALSEFVEFVGNDILVGHNVSFDINFLYDNCLRVLNVPLSNDFVDTLSLSKIYLNGMKNHKLETLADYLDIHPQNKHRAIADCDTTFECYNKLKLVKDGIIKNPVQEVNKKILDKLDIKTIDMFYNKSCAIHGYFIYFNQNFIEDVIKKLGGVIASINSFYSGFDFDYLILGQSYYTALSKNPTYGVGHGAYEAVKKGKLKILSEYQFYEILNIDIPKKKSNTKAKNITTKNTEFDPLHPLYDRVCVFTGTLEKMNRQKAMQFVVDLGGMCSDSITMKTNYLILGSNCYNTKSSKQRKAEELELKGQDIKIISEDVFYDMIDYDDEE